MRTHEKPAEWAKHAVDRLEQISTSILERLFSASASDIDQIVSCNKRNTMLVHTVIFWLKKDLSEDQRNIFIKEVKTLGEISSVHDFHLGTPAANSKRPVVEDSYDFAITVVLKDMVAHDDYQADPIHLNLLIIVRKCGNAVVIYDAD